MAKKLKVNKSAQVREFLTQHGWGMATTDAVKALNDMGVKVTYQTVHHIQAKHRKGVTPSKGILRSNRKAGGLRVGDTILNGSGDAMAAMGLPGQLGGFRMGKEDTLAAVALINRTGSIENAREALQLIEVARG